MSENSKINILVCCFFHFALAMCSDLELVLLLGSVPNTHLRISLVLYWYENIFISIKSQVMLYMMQTELLMVPSFNLQSSSVASHHAHSRMRMKE